MPNQTSEGRTLSETSGGERRFAVWRGLPIQPHQQTSALAHIGRFVLLGAAGILLIIFANWFAGFLGLSIIVSGLTYYIAMIPWSLYYARRLGKSREKRKDFDCERKEGFSFFATAVFRIHGRAYAMDEGIIALVGDQLLFDGYQTTFSLPIKQQQFSGRKGPFILRFSDPAFEVHVGDRFSLSVSDVKDLDLVRYLLPKGPPESEGEMLPPIVVPDAVVQQSSKINRPGLGLVLALGLVAILANTLVGSGFGVSASLVMTSLLAGVIYLLSIRENRKLRKDLVTLDHQFGPDRSEHGPIIGEEEKETSERIAQ